MPRQYYIPTGEVVDDTNTGLEFYLPSGVVLNEDDPLGSPVVLTPGTGAMTLEGNQPAILDREELILTPGTGALALQGNQPGIYPGVMLGIEGIWTWFTGPEVIYDPVEDAYYVGRTNKAADIGISKLMAGTGAITSFTLKAAHGSANDHNNPGLAMLPSGRVLSPYTSHGDSAMRWRVMTNPRDVTAWNAEQSKSAGLSTPISYSNLWYLSAIGRAYLHHRGLAGGVGQPETNLVYTADLGGSFSNAELMFQNTDSPNNTPYVISRGNGVNIIDFIGTDTHPDLGPSSILYWRAEVVSGDLHFYDAAGSELTLPIGPGDATLIYDGTTQRAWNWDIKRDADGETVHLLFVKFVTTIDHRYMYCKIEAGVPGTPIEVARGGTGMGGEQYYSGGACFDGNDPYRIYLSTNYDSTSKKIEEYASNNLGLTWGLERTVANVDDADITNARPVSPEGHNGVGAVWWWSGRYTSFTDFDTQILYARAINVPDAPTIGIATGGIAAASVAFTAPDEDGGSPVTSYTATSNPDGYTGTGSGSPITITDLPAGTYVFSVHATNANGNGAESDYSNAVVVTAAIVVAETGGGGGRKQRRIRYSDLSQREYEEELKAAVADMQIREFTPLEQAAYDMTEDEDDELLLKVLSLMVLH